MRRMGKAPWPNNPKYCSVCFKQMVEHRSGAEIECSLLFADVRGSTALAEQLRPVEFRGLMNRFFAAASEKLVDLDAVVDKFVGDEVIALFIPVLTGEQHARRAIEAARAVIEVAGAMDLPAGAGVNTGVAFVGTVGEGSHTEFTAMGDSVNVTARLASAAAPGEVLVTLAAAQAGGLGPEGLERRDLTLRGKSEAVQVLVVTSA